MTQPHYFERVTPARLEHVYAETKIATVISGDDIARYKDEKARAAHREELFRLECEELQHDDGLDRE